MKIYQPIIVTFSGKSLRSPQLALGKRHKTGALVDQSEKLISEYKALNWNPRYQQLETMKNHEN